MVDSLTTIRKHMEQKRLAEQMNVDTDAVQEAISQNAWSAQNQQEYGVRYDAVTDEIVRHGIR